ncbi:DsrE family protein [Streptomyces palmae]|uniref:Uncharacterized protein n=1 Tax=Streptomyces palmae TaxID=1701085 RepID=A0A4Z0HC83_9ACTN|nr:DsrE family protein [Streptomyces palmae]TGB10566.1 hypothetical protein E4099_12625 [Streptomyces palmae]
MARIPHTDVMISLFGAPYESERITTAFRLAQSLLDRGATVAIWTCGYSTALTCASLGDSKPRNLIDLDRDHPSTVRLVKDLLAGYPERLHWYVCRFCADERGMTEQIPQVKMKSAFRFMDHVAAADKLLCLGVC